MRRARRIPPAAKARTTEHWLIWLDRTRAHRGGRPCDPRPAEVAHCSKQAAGSAAEQCVWLQRSPPVNPRGRRAPCRAVRAQEEHVYIRSHTCTSPAPVLKLCETSACRPRTHHAPPAATTGGPRGSHTMGANRPALAGLSTLALSSYSLHGKHKARVVCVRAAGRQITQGARTASRSQTQTISARHRPGCRRAPATRAPTPRSTAAPPTPPAAAHPTPPLSPLPPLAHTPPAGPPTRTAHGPKAHTHTPHPALPATVRGNLNPGRPAQPLALCPPPSATATRPPPPAGRPARRHPPTARTRRTAHAGEGRRPEMLPIRARQPLPLLPQGLGSTGRPAGRTKQTPPDAADQPLLCRSAAYRGSCKLTPARAGVQSIQPQPTHSPRPRPRCCARRLSARYVKDVYASVPGYRRSPWANSLESCAYAWRNRPPAP